MSLFDLKVADGRAELRMKQRELEKKCMADGSVRLLRATIPMRPELGLLGAYGYRAGGEKLDLRGGVRSKIVRG